MNSNIQRTYDQVFQDPMTNKLEWNDVRTMFESLGTVEDQPNGNVTVTMSGRSIVFDSPTIADLTSADQVAKIRRLLKGPADSSPNGGPHMVLSINHQEAKIYQTEMKGSTPERVVPHHGLGHTNHVHSNHDYSDHIQKPNHKAYFETITNLLKDADKILIFGEGSGSSSAMDLYVDALRPKP